MEPDEDFQQFTLKPRINKRPAAGTAPAVKRVKSGLSADCAFANDESTLRTDAETTPRPASGKSGQPAKLPAHPGVCLASDVSPALHEGAHASGTARVLTQSVPFEQDAALPRRQGSSDSGPDADEARDRRTAADLGRSSRRPQLAEAAVDDRLAVPVVTESDAVPESTKVRGDHCLDDAGAVDLLAAGGRKKSSSISSVNPEAIARSSKESLNDAPVSSKRAESSSGSLKNQRQHAREAGVSVESSTLQAATKSFGCPLCGRLYKIQKFQIAHTSKCTPKVSIDSVGALVKKLEKSTGNGRRTSSREPTDNGTLISVKCVAPERFAKVMRSKKVKKQKLAVVSEPAAAQANEAEPCLSATKESTAAASTPSLRLGTVTRSRRRSSVKGATNSDGDKPLLLQLEPTLVKQLLIARAKELLSSAGCCSQATFTPVLLRSRMPMRPTVSSGDDEGSADTDLTAVYSKHPRLWHLASTRTTKHPELPCSGSEAMEALKSTDYYVRALMPPLSPCEVKTGSKLKQWSAIPGRDDDLPAERSASRTAEHVQHPRGVATPSAAAAAVDSSHSRLLSELASSTLPDYEHMVGSFVHSDMAVVTANGKIPCHSFVLAAKCPWVLEFVDSDRCLSMVDIGQEDVLLWLQFLYTGKQSFISNLSASALESILNVVRQKVNVTIPETAAAISICPKMKCSCRVQSAHDCGCATGLTAPEAPAAACSVEDERCLAMEGLAHSAVPPPSSPAIQLADSLPPGDPCDCRSLLIAMGSHHSQQPPIDSPAKLPPSTTELSPDAVAISEAFVQSIGHPRSQRADATATLAAATTASPHLSCSVIAPLTSSPASPVSIGSEPFSQASIAIIDVGESPVPAAAAETAAMISDDDGDDCSLRDVQLLSPSEMVGSPVRPRADRHVDEPLGQQHPRHHYPSNSAKLPSPTECGSKSCSARELADKVAPTTVRTVLATSTPCYHLPSTPTSHRQRSSTVPSRAVAIVSAPSRTAAAFPSLGDAAPAADSNSSKLRLFDCKLESACDSRSPDSLSSPQSIERARCVDAESAPVVCELGPTVVPCLDRRSMTPSSGAAEPGLVWAAPARMSPPFVSSPVVIDSDWSSDPCCSSPEPGSPTGSALIGKLGCRSNTTGGGGGGEDDDGELAFPLSPLVDATLTQLDSAGRAVTPGTATRDVPAVLAAAIASVPPEAESPVVASSSTPQYQAVSMRERGSQKSSCERLVRPALSPIIDLTQNSPSGDGDVFAAKAYDRHYTETLADDDTHKNQAASAVAMLNQSSCKTVSVLASCLPRNSLSAGRETVAGTGTVLQALHDVHTVSAASAAAITATCQAPRAAGGDSGLEAILLSPAIRDDEVLPQQSQAGIQGRAANQPSFSGSHELIDVGLDFDDSFMLDDISPNFCEPDPAAEPVVPPPGPIPASGTPPLPPPARRARHPPAIPSPFTPMPPYAAMDTPQLKGEVSRYGVKPNLSKKRMVLLLHDIYKQTHQYETDTSADLSMAESVPGAATAVVTCSSAGVCQAAAAGSRPAVTLLPGSCQQLHTATDAASMPTGTAAVTAMTTSTITATTAVLEACRGISVPSASSSESSGDDSDDDVLEESYVPAEEEEEAAAGDGAGGSQRMSVADLERQLLSFFVTDGQLYQKVLKYEPLEFDELLASVKSRGIRCSAAKLMNFCDDKCITYTMRKRSRATQDGGHTGRRRWKAAARKAT